MDIPPVSKAKDDPPKPAPAIGYSVVSNLGGERQMTVQCFVGEDETDEAVNSKIDRVLRVLDRQKAKYDLDKEEKEFEEVARHTRNFLNAIPLAEEGTKRQIAVLKVEMAGLVEAKNDVFNEAESKYHGSGRKGDYEPKGHVAQRIAVIEAEIAKKQEAIAAAPRDADQHREQAMINVFKYQDDMRTRRRRINDLRAMAGLPGYRGFEAEEMENPMAKG